MEPKSTDQLVELTLNDYYCKICNVKNGSIINYTNHLNGVKHQKKLIRLQEDNKKINEEKTNEPKPAVNGFEVSNDDNEENMKNCKICNKIFSCKDNAVAHYKSKGHLHKLSIAEKTWKSECDKCNKKFSSEFQWKQHLISKGHLKLSQQINANNIKPIDEFRNVFEDEDKMEFEAKIALEVLKDLYCHLCAKKFSGKKPVEDHLKCFEHKRHVRIGKENEERKRKNDNKDGVGVVVVDEDWEMPNLMGMKAEKKKRDLEIDENEVEKNYKKHCADSEENIDDWSSLSRKEMNIVVSENKKRGLEDDEDEQVSKKMKLKVEEESVNIREEDKVIEIKEENEIEIKEEEKENENKIIKVNDSGDDDDDIDDYDIDDDDSDDGDSVDDDGVDDDDDGDGDDNGDDNDDDDDDDDDDSGWCTWDVNETLDLDDYNDSWNKSYLDDDSYDCE